MNKIPLFITADDYSVDPGIDAAILDGIEAGGITGVSIWVDSAPYQFSNFEVKILKKIDIGLHWGAFELDIDLNRPTTWHFIKFLLWPSKGDLAKAEKAWSCAYNSLIRYGLRPRFINGHQHVHLFPRWILPISKWAKLKGIKIMRRPMEVGLGVLGYIQTRPAIALLSFLGWFASRHCKQFSGVWIPAICRWGRKFSWEQALKELKPLEKNIDCYRRLGLELVLHPGRPTTEFLRKTKSPCDYEGQFNELVRSDLSSLLANTCFKLAKFSDYFQ